MDKMEKVFVVLSFLIFCSCQAKDSHKGKIKEVEEIRLGRQLKPSEIIRNPLSESGLDTSRVARLKFQNERINFGVVKEGDLVKKYFKFTNTGNYPLYILEAFSTCGCTVPDWPKEMIKPGADGVIVVHFNTEGKVNNQRKAITIISNTFPTETVVYLEGNVIPKTK